MFNDLINELEKFQTSKPNQTSHNSLPFVSTTHLPHHPPVPRVRGTHTPFQNTINNPLFSLSSHKTSQHFFFSLLFLSTLLRVMAFSVNSFVAALVAALFFAATTAQDLSPAPAPGPDAGAAGSVSSSVAVIGASVVLSMFALFKHWI